MCATVNHKTCVDCGLCQKVCPSLNFEDLYNRQEDPYNGTIINTYIVRSSDADIYDNAQSGGMCTTTLKYLFDNHLIDTAVVCQTVVSKNPAPKAILVKDPSHLMHSQKSNYTPVEILSILKELKGTEKVAIVGLPCHIKASVLLAERIKKYDVIKYRLGLICDRTLCNGINDVFASLSNLSSFKVIWRRKNFTFNGHYYSYKNSPVALIDNNNQEKIVYPNRYRMVLKDMFTAPHCRICYDKVNVFSDIVFGDPWCLDEVDWDKGDSLVLTRTVLGDNLMHHLLRDGYGSQLRKTDPQKALDGQFVFERKEQFPYYVSAFRSIFTSNTADKVFESIPYIEGDLFNTARNELLQFLNDEGLPKETIVKKALSIIKTEKKKLFIGKCKSGLKQILKKIIRK